MAVCLQGSYRVWKPWNFEQTFFQSGKMTILAKFWKSQRNRNVSESGKVKGKMESVVRLTF